MSEFRITATRLGSRRPIVRFEPTPHHVVRAMLELAEVSSSDVLYDLGSGDGRIPIAAAKHCGAHAVGIEIHQGRIERAIERARKEGVSRRARFIRQDLFEADIRPATVVTLFLLPEVNWMLRPKLLADLAPGTRIVSYIHEMGLWKPQKARYTVDRLGWYHRVYLWIVPERGEAASGAASPRNAGTGGPMRST